MVRDTRGYREQAPQFIRVRSRFSEGGGLDRTASFKNREEI
jgi:hypothetical protein